jgi:cytochrome c556
MTPDPLVLWHVLRDKALNMKPLSLSIPFALFAVTVLVAAQAQPVGTVHDIMEAITIPASNAVFAAASEPPKEAAQWAAVRRQALTVAESSNLLMMAGRAVDQKDWTQWASAQLKAAQAVMKAAQAKDADALQTASDALFETCEGCHTLYMKK